MHLILCVDTRDGLSFGGRRLSRDICVTDHILSLTNGHSLWVHPYSAQLFPADTVVVDVDFQSKAGQGDYCFVETSPLLKTNDALESVILYCWNRSYPATEKLDRNLLKGMRLSDTEEFTGNSHETITMQRYTL